jgi:hypothetical protein
VWPGDHVPPSLFLRISATAFKPEALVPASELTAFGEDDQKPRIDTNERELFILLGSIRCPVMV